MTRRRFLQSCAALSAAAAGCATSGPQFDSSGKIPRGRPPNLILLLTDDQRWDSLSCAGNRVLRTPNIDSLAAGGVAFRQAFATTAICVCSRASILTGMYTRCHGIDDFSKPLPDRLRQQTYAALLRRAGYRTGFVGKWGLGGELPRKDYDYFTGYSGQGFYFEPGQTKHLTTRQADQAVAFVRGCKKNQPFCLSVSFKAPHVQDEGRNQPGIYAKYPYDPALQSLYERSTVRPPKTRDATPMPAFLDRTLNRTREAPDFSPANYQETMRDLYRLLAGVDIAVGRIVDAVRELGALDNTVILYTSDHGSFYGEHGFGGKWLMYEESIRTPTIFFDPRLPIELRHTACQEMVLNIDLCPTLLDLAGVPIPVTVQGSSVAPLMYGQNPPWRSEWFYEHPFNDNYLIAPSEGIRTHRWKYVRYVESWPLCEQLFDLASDPREEHNLVDELEYRDILKSLRARWELWGDRLSNWSAEERWSDPAPHTTTA